ESSVCTTACSATIACASGEACVSGKCALLPSACVSASDCPTGKTCSNAICTDACIGSRDCRDGLVCSFGVCVAPGTGCLEDSNCASGKACSPNGECVASCTMSAECASGEACSNGACVSSGPATATLSGLATFTGLADHSSITVTVKGPSNDRVTTGASGAYSFVGLKPGRYELIFAAPSTRELQLSVDVAALAGADTTVPTTSFTPVGILTGNVKLQGNTQHAGIQVALVGQNIVTNTDTAGDFTLRNVPVGTHQLLATAPLFLAASVMTTPVVYNMSVTQPDITIAPAPVTTGSVFSFVTAPPNTGKVGVPYVYTAVAGGGGIQAPSYAVVQGLGNMAIDASTGVMTYTPSSSDSGSHWVILSATGGNATVYQIFALTIEQPFRVIAPLATGNADSLGAITWATQSSSTATVTRIVDGGVAATFPGSAEARSSTFTSASLVNGGTITSVQVPTGTLTGVGGTVGTLGLTWQGGTVGSVAPTNAALTVASKSAFPAITSTRLIDGDVIADVTFPSGVAQSITDGRAVPTSIVPAASGVVTSVTSTVLTDSSATFVSGTVNGQCISDQASTNWLTITSSTATTLTISSGNLTSILSAGRRYFIVNCSTGLTPYTLTQTGAAFGSLTSKVLDFYEAGYPINDYAVVSNTATTILFGAPTYVFTDLMAVPTAGFYTVADPAGTPVTLTNPSAAFAGGLSATNRVAFDNMPSGSFAITANTATTITFTVPTSSLGTLSAAGMNYRLTNTSSQTPVTLSFPTANFPSYTGRSLWVDGAFTTFTVASNTATSIVVNVDSAYFPLTAWKGGHAAVYTSSRPVFELTDSTASYPVNGLAGLRLFRIVGTSAAWRGTVVSNTATTVTFTSSNTGTIRDLLTFFDGARYGFGTQTNTIRQTVTVNGTPNWAIDSLVGRAVAQLDAPAFEATVMSNTASALTLEFSTSSTTFNAFDTMPVGAALVISTPTAPYGDTGYRLTLTDPTATYGVNALAGFNVVNDESNVVGFVLSNTATQLQLSVTELSYLPRLRPGAVYALANPQLGGCSPSGRIAATATLTGATLTTNAYQGVTTSNSGLLQVTSNTTSALTGYFCPSSLTTMMLALGAPAMATNGGRGTITLTDSAAAYAAQALVGRRLFFPQLSDISSAITSNTATQVVLSASPTDFTEIAASASIGARYVVVDTSNNATVNLVTNLSLGVDALKGRVVMLHTATNNDAFSAWVDTNTATTLSLRVGTNDIDSFLPPERPFDRVTTSAGATLTVTDPTAAFTAGALVGQAVTVAGYPMQIVANTATTFTASAASTGVLIGARTSNLYTFSGPSSTALVATLANGDGVTVSNDGATPTLRRYGPSGVVARFNALNTGRAMTLQATTAVSGGTINLVTSSGGLMTFRDQAATLTPNAHVGWLLRARISGTSTYSYLVVSNTAKTITVYSTSSTPSVGTSYTLEPLTYTVTGGGLTAGALVGKRLRLNGADLAIRGNTATTVTVVPSFTSYFDAYPLAISVDATTPAWVLEGLSGTVSGITRSGNGFVVASSTGVIRFDGTSWARFGEVETATSASASGTVTSTSGTNVYDSSANYVSNALAGKRLRLPSGVFSISGNSRDTLFLSGIGNFTVPLPGEAYSVLNDDGLTSAADVAFATNVLWVATPGRGLFRLQGSAWSRFTVASTESSPGLGNGLATNTLYRVHSAFDTEVFTSDQPFYSVGVSRLSMTTWTQLSAATTASAPGLTDGLPSNTVYDVLSLGSSTWFATSDGVARLAGSTWTTIGSVQGLPSSNTGALVTGPTGQIWYASTRGLVQLNP
ncbi:MAG: hypothetical protein JNG84_01640, partial [Archangium sp.]|nr:hypothetical protein [Archangium sp.]